MIRTIVIAILAAAGAFAGMLMNGSRLNAADEIRCRVNVEALVQDITALKQAKPDIDSEFVKQLLQPKKP
jgi:hypothetical protein